MCACCNAICLVTSSVCVDDENSATLTAVVVVVGTEVSTVFLTTQTNAAPALPVLSLGQWSHLRSLQLCWGVVDGL